MNLQETIIFGLDLSFNSTGISMLYFDENGNNTKVGFDRVVYDKHPRKIENINTFTYTLPVNITIQDLIVGQTVGNELDQLEITLKSLICSKAIKTVLKQYIEQLKPKQCLFVIENYIMPSFGGKNSLQNVSGLIALQTYVREFAIQLKIQSEIDVRLSTPTPTQVKKIFTGNGKAQKADMLQAFVSKYNGDKLFNTSQGKLDDVIDAFALSCFGLSSIRISDGTN